MSAAEVTIEEWLEVWGGVVGRARKMDDLPMWLQFYPKTLFDTINRSGSGVITKQELNLFYTAFLGTNKQQLDSFAAGFPTSLDLLLFTHLKFYRKLLFLLLLFSLLSLVTFPPFSHIHTLKVVSEYYHSLCHLVVICNAIGYKLNNLL